MRPAAMARTALIALLLAGCASMRTPAPPTWIGPTWYWAGTLTPLHTVIAADPTRYTATFAPDGKLALLADCNRGSASWTKTTGDGLTVGPIALTRMMCPPGSQSDGYLKQIAALRAGNVRAGLLFGDMMVDGGSLVFAPTPQAKLVPYRCTNGPRLTAIVADEGAWLLDSDQIHELRRAKSASGSRYENDTVSFFTKGDEATLEIKGADLPRRCTAVAANEKGIAATG